MRRSSSRPWPALVDLFSALFITAFAGFVLLTGKTDIEVQKAQIRATVDSINVQIKEVFETSAREDFNPERRGDDIVFNFNVAFERNKDVIRDEEDRELIATLATSIRESISSLSSHKQRYVQVVIEGHTDSQQPWGVTDPRTRYLFNWQLSSLRATSVLYEFKKAGLSPEEYSVYAIGYADSRPLCYEDTEDCHELNRRTSLRLRPDMAQIEQDFEGGAEAIE